METKKNKKSIKSKLFKTFSILSFILNFLFILLLILGSCTNNSVDTAKALSLETDYSVIYQKSFKPLLSYTYVNYSDRVSSYKNSTTDYSQAVVGTTTLSNTTNSPIGLFHGTETTYSNFYKLDLTFNGYNSTNILVFKFYTDISYSSTRTINITSTTSTNALAMRFSNYNFNISDYKAFCLNFYIAMRCNALTNDIYPNSKPFVLKPFVYLDNFVLGVTYPIDIKLTSYHITSVTESNTYYFYYMYFDYSGSIILKSTSNFYFLGVVQYDNTNRPYLNFYQNTEVPSTSNMIDITLFDGYYYNSYVTSQPIADFIYNNSQEVFTSPDSSQYVNCSGRYYLNWAKWFHTLIDINSNLNSYNYSYTLNIHFSINGINEPFKQIILTDSLDSNTHKHNGSVVCFSESNNSYSFYSWSNLDPKNYDYSTIVNSYYQNIYTEFPFFITLNIDSLIYVNDYALFSYIISPLSLPFGDIDTRESFNDVFLLFGNSFSSIFGFLNIEIFPGVTLLVLVLIPFAVFLIIAIIKLIKG